MKRLLVMRHAKSSWNDSQMTDFDRPLNRRGERDAPRMAKAIQASDCLPDMIISSAANRAKATATAIAKEIGCECPLEFTDRLYGASVADYLRRLGELPDDCQCVLVVGHNPTIEQLIVSLTGQAVAMPTAALATVDLSILDWRALDFATPCQLIDVWRPRELP